MKIISEHKKNYGMKGGHDYNGNDYKWTRPAKKMKRVMAIVDGRTRHVDVPAA